MRRILPLLIAIALLISIPLPACADSDDYIKGYRDGYEDGFQRGLEAALSGLGSSAEKSSSTPAAEKEPINGAVLYGERQPHTGAMITVNASADQAVVVLLKSPGGVPKFAFYVRAGKTITISVPHNTLNAYFASGNGANWCGYGEGKMFGDSTVYSKDDHLLHLTQYAYTYTLYPVTDGNFEQTPIDEDDFF